MSSARCRYRTCPDNVYAGSDPHPTAVACSVFHDLLTSYYNKDFQEEITISADFSGTKFDGIGDEVAYSALCDQYRTCDPSEKDNVVMAIYRQYADIWSKMTHDEEVSQDYRSHWIKEIDAVLRPYRCRITDCPTNMGKEVTADPSSYTCSVYHALMDSQQAGDHDRAIILSSADFSGTRFSGLKDETSYRNVLDVYGACRTEKQWDIEQSIRAESEIVRKKSQPRALKGDDKLRAASEIRAALGA